MVKPLFIPLRTEFFNAFKSGEKDTEYRLAGGRWNTRTCPAGRAVTLSKGYGRHGRFRGVILAFEESWEPCHGEAWRSCYGEGSGPAACIKIELEGKG